MIRDARGVIDLWETATQLAADIGVPEGTVYAWRSRNAIPPGYWSGIVESALKRGLGGVVTLELLARIAKERRKRRPAEAAEPRSAA